MLDAVVADKASRVSKRGRELRHDADEVAAFDKRLQYRCLENNRSALQTLDAGRGGQLADQRVGLRRVVRFDRPLPL